MRSTYILIAVLLIGAFTFYIEEARITLWKTQVIKLEKQDSMNLLCREYDRLENNSLDLQRHILRKYSHQVPAEELNEYQQEYKKQTGYLDTILALDSSCLKLWK